MSHHGWTDQLSDYMNGDLPSEEVVTLEAHLASCGDCRDALVELREVVAAARALGPVEPPRDLWAGIAAAIAAPVKAGGRTVIPLPTAGQAVPSNGLFLSRRQLAAAASILMLVSAAATWAIGFGMPGATAGPAAQGLDPTGDVSFAAERPAPPAGLADELADLEALMNQARDVMDPATLRVLETNLAVIEAAIEDSYRALAVDPENEFLTEHLRRTFQRKADYLSNVAQVAGWSG